MDIKVEDKLEVLILRKLYEFPGHEAVLVPSLFMPPIMLSNIFRVGCQLKRKGLTSNPDRRMGGWHLRLLGPGVAFCQSTAASR